MASGGLRGVGGGRIGGRGGGEKGGKDDPLPGLAETIVHVATQSLLGEDLPRYSILDHQDNGTHTNISQALNPHGPQENFSMGLAPIVGLSAIFCVVGIVGIIGNVLVIYIVLSDKKMRTSVTNLFIMNLALADLLIMIFGVPEIVMFMINKGWILGEDACKIQRFILVVSLYASVLTLVSVCIERYVLVFI